MVQGEDSSRNNVNDFGDKVVQIEKQILKVYVDDDKYYIDYEAAVSLHLLPANSNDKERVLVSKETIDRLVNSGFLDVHYIQLRNTKKDLEALSDAVRLLSEDDKGSGRTR